MTTVAALAPPVSGGAVPAPAALQATLDQLQQRLSDCVNCASASTPRGKADIARTEAQIAQVRTRLADLAPTPPAPPAPAAPSAAAPRAPASATLGTRIDVYS